MTTIEINKTYQRIVGRLDRIELKSACDALQGLIAGTGEHGFQDQLDQWQNTYKYMLHYRMNGVQDPMQEQIYNQVQAACYELADRVKQRGLAVDSPTSFYSQRRMQRPTSLRGLHELLQNSRDIARIKGNKEGKQQMEEARAALFQYVWASGFLSAEEVSELRLILRDEELPTNIGCLLASALLLGLNEFFDVTKMELLFDAAASREPEIAVRALIALLLMLYKYRRRTHLYPQLDDRLQALSETSPTFTKALLQITLRFILARETEKISDKLQNEILPEMMKWNETLGKKINLKDLTPEQLSNEMNPEWQEAIFSDSGLAKKMTEFSELQLEGADVLHSTFVHLKDYPFFREISNWFLPFSIEHTALDGVPKSQDLTLMDTVMEASFMCNSDKYSLYLSMMSLPESARKMMLTRLDGQAAEIIQQNKEELLGKRSQTELIAGQYVQDLYRFFKLYPRHLDFDDLFAYPLDFHNLPVLRPFLSDEGSLSTIAAYYLRKHYFQDALTAFARLVEKNPEDDVLFQKTGYCRQMTNDIAGALQDYLHADLLNPRSPWVIRRIAGCYRTLKQPAQALEYYHRYETLQPDNLSVQISIGHCHLELKNYNEALKYFYKVDYLDAESHKAWRPIAWCSFLTGKYDQARHYYGKILNDNPNMQDYLNAGHTEWALQNMKQVIDYYQEALRKENGDWNKFYEQFEQDIPDLEKAGIERDEIPLLLDEVRYQY